MIKREIAKLAAAWLHQAVEKNRMEHIDRIVELDPEEEFTAVVKLKIRWNSSEAVASPEGLSGD